MTVDAVPPIDITCRELVELVTDYLEDALVVAERARFVAHLADCPPCCEYLTQMQRTIAALGSLRRAEIATADRDRLLQLFRTWRDNSAPQS